MRASTCLFILLSVWCSACGGNVDLGSRDRSSSSPPNDPAIGSPDEPNLVESERTLEFEHAWASGALALAGEFIYLSSENNQFAIYRCKKASCQSTLERVSSMNNPVFFQADGDRLGVLGVDSTAWIASYALPNLDDRQVVISGLARDPLQVFFHGGFVYWPMSFDGAYYRCSLPACEGAPGKLLDAKELGSINADGSSLLVVADGRIARLAELGDGPIEYFRGDAMWSVIPPGEEDAADIETEHATNAVGQGGVIYATVKQKGCGSSCPTSIVRWAPGAAREELFSSETDVPLLRLAGQELIWTTAWSDGTSRAYLNTCRVEDCGATFRRLDVVSSEFRGFDVDGERLYWIGNGYVRSVQLLLQP